MIREGGGVILINFTGACDQILGDWAGDGKAILIRRGHLVTGSRIADRQEFGFDQRLT
jgi:hypothetical protein